MSILNLVGAFEKPVLSDRTLPPVPGTSPEAFEALYAGRPDPWGVLGSPLAYQRYLALVEIVGQYSPCGSILDVGCGEGALTRYLVGCAAEVLYYVKLVDAAIEKLLTLGRSVIISYTSRERQRLDPCVAAYCPPERRAFYPFFGLSGFGCMDRISSRRSRSRPPDSATGGSAVGATTCSSSPCTFDRRCSIRT